VAETATLRRARSDAPYPRRSRWWYPARGSLGSDGWLFTFDIETNGEVVWNGTTVQLTRSSYFAGHIVEYSANAPPASWNLVTNTIAPVGDLLGLTLKTVGSAQFYRLRKP